LDKSSFKDRLAHAAASEWNSFVVASFRLTRRGVKLVQDQF
jgi:hypothetical protein